MRNQPLLVVEHEAGCPPGWIGEWLADAGAELDVRRPYNGDALPDDLAAHGGLVVLGGSMHASSDGAHPWLTRTKELVLAATDDGTPTLGICLGHQLIAVALGGEVGRNPHGQQIGVIEVAWQAAAGQDSLFGGLGPTRAVVQWNNDVVTRLPDHAVVLAGTASGGNQAARFAPAMWGVQWHPEAGEEIVAAWADSDRDHARERGVDVDEYVAQVAGAREELRRSGRMLADGFLAVVAGSVPAS